MTDFLPYARHWLDESDIQAVAEVLRSDWLTTGPAVSAFEEAVATEAGHRYGVAVNSGTAALHCAMRALGVGPGDEVIVPPMTFAATANAVLYEGATPVFADVDPHSLLLDPERVRACCNERTRAIIAVDYAGQPADYEALAALARQWNAALVVDACHSLGARYHGAAVGAYADLAVFSFHPVKPISSGEGGMVTCENPAWFQHMRRFRNHGIDVDSHQRQARGGWQYEVVELGFNYRLTDIQAALGRSQLNKLPRFNERRRAIAARYDAALADLPGITPLHTRPEVRHAYHLYVVRVERQRDRLFERLRAEGIGVNIHYPPVHLHPLYRQRLGSREGLCPVAEAAYHEILSLPLFPAMGDRDVERVIASTAEALA